MIDFYSLLGTVLLFGALLIPGYILGKYNRVSDAAIIGITNIMTDVAMPFLVFVKLIETDLSDLAVTDVVCGLLIPIVSLFLMFFISRAFYRKEDASGRACTIFPNCGFLSIPLAAAMFPDRPVIVVLVSMFNLVNSFLILTLGVYIFSEDKRHISIKKVLCKPISIAIVVGVLLSILGINEKLPALVTYSNYLASLCTPLSMLVLGVELSKFKLRKLFTSGAVYLGVFVKLILSPLLILVILVLLKYVFGLAISEELTIALFLGSGVSNAATLSAMARTYGRDAERATILTLSTTIFCMATLPIMSTVFGLVF